jgi:hypothetical protein
MKGTVCSIAGWVISNQAGLLDKAYQALKGPDWWELVYVLGASACQLIPGDGAAGYAKDVLCGPLAAALLEAKKWAEAVGGSVVAASDAVENLVFGDDSHMPYETYYALYWQPWYHYSTNRVFNGQGLGGPIDGIYSRCVDYFDSHNQYRKTAKKTCGNMRNKFSNQVNGLAAALPVAVEGYFEWVARPAIRAAAAAGYGKPASQPPPGEDFFVMNCTFQLRKNIYFPEPDDGPCTLLAERGEKYMLEKSNVFGFGSLYQMMADVCFKNVALQDVQPTVWAQACHDMRASYGQVFAGETLKLAKTIGDLTKAGCAKTIAADSGKLRMECQAYGAYSQCLEKFHPNGKQYCHMPPLKMSDTKAALQTAPVNPGDIQFVAPAQSGQPATLPGSREPGAPVVKSPPRLVPPREVTSPGSEETVRDTEAAVKAIRAQSRPLWTSVEAESLITGGKFQVQGGQAVMQEMTGFGPGWSGNAQAFWHGGSAGATLDFFIDVPRDGAWVIEIDFTRAPDYGQLELQVGRHLVDQLFDGYAPQVTGPVSFSLGTFALLQGQQAVSLKIIGHNVTATGWLAGVDRIRLRPAE